ncbi:hypothetical protein AEYBE204_16680 [Asticcacaulis sp. YBE204]|nr:hypothetical protein AEYBE204_16680 [Asticcacaulis sp. YBE204]
MIATRDHCGPDDGDAHVRKAIAIAAKQDVRAKALNLSFAASAVIVTLINLLIVGVLVRPMITEW